MMDMNVLVRRKSWKYENEVEFYVRCRFGSARREREVLSSLSSARDRKQHQTWSGEPASV